MPWLQATQAAHALPVKNIQNVYSRLRCSTLAQLIWAVAIAMMAATLPFLALQLSASSFALQQMRLLLATACRINLSEDVWHIGSWVMHVICKSYASTMQLNVAAVTCISQAAQLCSSAVSVSLAVAYQAATTICSNISAVSSMLVLKSGQQLFSTTSSILVVVHQGATQTCTSIGAAVCVLLKSVLQLGSIACSVSAALCQACAQGHSSISATRLLEAVRVVQPLIITATCVIVIYAAFKVSLRCMLCSHCMTPCHMQQL